jgi:hypothetical protein
MFLLYMDESGVTQRHPTQTSHYVMIGMAVHVGTWFALTQRVRGLKKSYALDGNTEALELHAAWMLRAYQEQSLIPNFEQLSFRARRDAVMQWREEHKRTTWPSLDKRALDQAKKAFRRTEPYVHLTRNEREELYSQALERVCSHRRGVTLFGEAIEKQQLPPGVDAAEEAFGKLVKRFEDFLQDHEDNPWGILLVDNDQTRSARYTALLHRFQQQAGFRGGVDRVIEAPFFLESKANAGVQVADLCAYALRRYLENEERERFETIFPKFHRARGGLSGLGHFTAKGCSCLICSEAQPTKEPRRRRGRRRKG